MTTPVGDILASEKAWQRRAERAEAEIERLRRENNRMRAALTALLAACDSIEGAPQVELSNQLLWSRARVALK